MLINWLHWDPNNIKDEIFTYYSILVTAEHCSCKEKLSDPSGTMTCIKIDICCTPDS